MRRASRILMIGAVVLVAAAAHVGAAETDPPWSVDEELLAAGLACPSSFSHPEREPVLLVHGTVTTGAEQFGWNYSLLLPDRGFDVCIVTYPDRGLGDLQESAEYVAHAILSLHQRTGRLVDVMGHSQGGLLPRWAIKFWPSAQAAVDDAVLVAPPSHGTSLADGTSSSPTPVSAAFYQLERDSEFIRALNAGDETPGDVSWSILYSDHDVLVQPATPVPTAALDWGVVSPRVRNVRLQDVCPGRVVDHLSIGTTDRLSQELVLDAFAHPGPVDPRRLGPAPTTCLLPDQQVDPDQLAALVEQFPVSFAGGFPDFHAVDAEPPLKPYAAAALAPPAPSQGAPTAGPAQPTDSVPAPHDAAPARTLPATGGSVPTALVPALLLPALLAVRVLRRS